MTPALAWKAVLGLSVIRAGLSVVFRMGATDLGAFFVMPLIGFVYAVKITFLGR